MAPAQPVKSKQNKTTLIALIAVAAVIVVVLVVILIMQFLQPPKSSGGSENGGGTNSNTSVNVDTNDSTNTPSTPSGNGSSSNSSSTTPSSTTATSVLSCTRSMTTEEIAAMDPTAASGTIVMLVDFDSDKIMTDLMMTKNVYGEVESTTAEPLATESQSVSADELSDDAATVYELPVNNNGTVLTTLDNIQMNYEVLDYVCEIL